MIFTHGERLSFARTHQRLSESESLKLAGGWTDRFEKWQLAQTRVLGLIRSVNRYDDAQRER